MNNSNAHANTAPVKKIRGLKRKLIQIAAFGFTNAHIPNFLSGKLYTGKWKEFCAPGLNCYSCPAAAFACPIGALQAVTGSRKSPISFYVFGLLLAFGVIFGRAVCGFLCPFGLLQELLAKVPLPKKKLPAFMRYIKVPAFCKYICPVGTLEGGIPALLTQPSIRSMLGPLFSWKIGILIAVIFLCMFVHRFFCKVLCPLGAVYGLLNKVSIEHRPAPGRPRKMHPLQSLRAHLQNGRLPRHASRFRGVHPVRGVCADLPERGNYSGCGSRTF